MHLVGTTGSGSMTITLASGDHEREIACHVVNIANPTPQEDTVKLNIACKLTGNAFRIQTTSSLFLSAGPGSPVITGYTSGTALFVGDSLAINCKSCGANPAPTMVWEYRSTGDVIGSTSVQEADGCTNLDLTFASIASTDNTKIYDCKVDNAIGSPTSDSVTLNVHGEILVNDPFKVHWKIISCSFPFQLSQRPLALQDTQQETV